MPKSKVLRSRILEYFPKELRVEIELLSMQRKASKEADIDELLRKYNIKGVTKLGPGTNRYAIKIGGYVVKFATDHDGKIDNLKEFKMSPLLYPYVTRTYEVSSSGTFLVAEYIQPFSSYSEMVSHGDEIRAILKKLSSRYLIGDIGITSVNFANWGTRIGSDEPVCLDFAYVYDVKSNLFVCRNCHTNTMLVPDENFVTLVCPTCKKTTTFTTIRGLIGNDLHNHEIGDLTEEGYVLSEPSSLVELDNKRSKYLAKGAKEKMKVNSKREQERIREEMRRSALGVDNFEVPEFVKSISYVAFSGQPQTQYSIDDEYDEYDEEEEWDEDEDDEYEEEEDIEEDEKLDDEQVDHHPAEGKARLAFSVPLISKEVAVAPIKAETVKAEPVSSVQKMPIVVSSVGIADTKPDTKIEDDGMGDADIPVDTNKGKPSPSPEKHFQIKGPDEDYDPLFVSKAQAAVSKLSNKIGDFWKQADIYDDGHIVDVWAEMEPHIRKMWKKVGNLSDLISTVQSTLYKSLIDFCGFTEIKSEGKSKWTFDPSNVGESNPTVRFVEEYWMNRSINALERDELIAKFAELGIGFQPEFRETYKGRVMRLGIDEAGAEMICRWYIDPLIVGNSSDASEEDSLVPAECGEAGISEEDDLPEGIPYYIEDNPVIADVTPQYETTTGESLGTTSNKPDELNYSSSQENYDEVLNTRIMVSHDPDDENDVKILIMSSDTESGIIIPLYISLDRMPHELPVPIADERNGIWEFLAHITPERILTLSEGEFQPGIVERLGSQRYIVRIILDTADNGTLVVGEYDVTLYNDLGVYDNDFLNMVCGVICREVGTTAVSALGRTLRIFFSGCWDDSVDDSEVDEVDDSDIDHYVASLMAALNDEGLNDDDEDEDDEDEDIVDVDNNDDDDDIVTFQPIRRRVQRREED